MADDTVTEADQAPETVPVETDQDQETVPAQEPDAGEPRPDGKIPVSQVQYDMVDGDKSKYVVVAPDADVVEVEEEEPEEEIEEEKPAEEETKPVEEEPAGEITETKIGGNTVRTYPDGRAEMLLIVDGEEVWYDMAAVQKDAQIMKHNQAEAQRLAREKKERDELERLVQAVTIATPQPVVQPEGEADVFAAEKTQTPELAAMQQQLVQLSQQLKASEEKARQAEIEAQQAAQAQFAYQELRNWAKETSSPMPSIPQLEADIQAEATRTGKDPRSIGISPAYLIRLAKQRFQRQTKPETETETETKPEKVRKPPEAAPVKKPSSPSGKLQKAKARLKQLRADRMKPDNEHDQSWYDGEIINVNREIEQLQGR